MTKCNMLKQPQKTIGLVCKQNTKPPLTIGNCERSRRARIVSRSSSSSDRQLVTSSDKQQQWHKKATRNLLFSLIVRQRRQRIHRQSPMSFFKRPKMLTDDGVTANSHSCHIIISCYIAHRKASLSSVLCKQKQSAIYEESIPQKWRRYSTEQVDTTVSTVSTILTFSMYHYILMKSKKALHTASFLDLVSKAVSTGKCCGGLP